jgi:hypothetical protein
MRPSPCLLSVLFVALGCGGSDDSADTIDDVDSGAAVTPVAGGSTGSGGARATGGSMGAGGTTANGGATGSGGATGTGGAVNNDGGPPHVVGACNGLGAVNQWENITPTSVKTALSIAADPVHAGTVYTGTAGTGIHRSTDCGATFTKVNTGTGGDVIDSGGQWSMVIDPVEPNVLFAGSLYGSDPSLQKSTNGGVDWASVFPAGSEVATTVDYNFFQEVSMDPTDHRHLVASFHADCKGAYAPMCMAESKDSGATWRLFKGPASGWVENARPMVLGATSFLYVSWADGVYYTADNGATWQKLSGIPGANHQMFAAAGGTFYVGTYAGVHKSANGHDWTKIDGSPGGADGLVGDGTRMFTGVRDASNQQPFFSAPEAGGTPWATLASPNMPHGPVGLAYDADHHVLYAANTDSGVWRMVTQ